MPTNEKEKSQKLQEKFQAILSSLLREEDNKYCVDCDAKGPRWASWNLGIFLCIRCAGIHRNLGVHISRVKSVNLDQWTAEQIASMQAMGNSKARDIYERNLSENFRRSQTDSAMEQFIRAKYEQKKWIAKDWTPGSVTVAADLKEDIEAGKEKRKSNATKISLGTTGLDSSKSMDFAKKSPKTTNPSNPSNNLKEIKSSVENSLPLVDFGTEPVTTTDSNQVNFATFSNDLFETNGSNSNVNYSQNISSVNPQVNLFEDTFNSIQQTVKPQKSNNSSSTTFDLEGLVISPTVIETNKKIDKNSILALYSQAAPANKTSTIPNSNSSNSFANMQQQSFKSNGIFQNNSPSGILMNNQPKSNNLTNNQMFNFSTNTNTQQNFGNYGQMSNQIPAPNKDSMFMNFFEAPKPTPTSNPAAAASTFSADLWQ